MIKIKILKKLLKRISQSFIDWLTL